MLKTLLKGFLFGIGFLVAITAGLYIFVLYDKHTLPTAETGSFEIDPWHSLSLEEQLHQASALLVVRFTAGQDGENIASVAEIHKKSASVVVIEKIGDPSPKDNYFPDPENHFNRNGIVVFLSGSPAKYKHGLYLYNDRLAGTSDMPLDILPKRFKGQ